MHRDIKAAKLAECDQAGEGQSTEEGGRAWEDAVVGRFGDRPPAGGEHQAQDQLGCGSDEAPRG